MHLLINFRDPCLNYGLSPATVRLYWQGMDALSKHISIWPHPSDLISHGCKFTYLQHLKEISEEITHTKYPDTSFVEDPLSPSIIENEDDIRPLSSIIKLDQEIHTLPSSMHVEGMVLKRTFSSSHQHVLQMTGNAEYQTVIKEKIDETTKQYGYFGDWIKPAWFTMPYIDTMKFGELRAFFVGGHLIYVLLTQYEEGSFSVDPIVLINPLSSLNTR